MGRLSSSVEGDIEKLHNEASNEQKAANDYKRNKREAEIKLDELDKKMNSLKVKCCLDLDRCYLFYFFSKYLSKEIYQYCAACSIFCTILVLLMYVEHSLLITIRMKYNVFI